MVPLSSTLGNHTYSPPTFLNRMQFGWEKFMGLIITSKNTLFMMDTTLKRYVLSCHKNPRNPMKTRDFYELHVRWQMFWTRVESRLF